MGIISQRVSGADEHPSQNPNAAGPTVKPPLDPPGSDRCSCLATIAVISPEMWRLESDAQSSLLGQTTAETEPHLHRLQLLQGC